MHICCTQQKSKIPVTFTLFSKFLKVYSQTHHQHLESAFKAAYLSHREKPIKKVVGCAKHIETKGSTAQFGDDVTI